MRPQENYIRYVVVGLGLTFAILASFQLYILREPARILQDEAHDQAQAVSEGQALFTKNCATCHGAEGEGDVGPSLNDKQFLSTTGDDVIFSLISSGVPGSQMPAWNQSHGGPFTDENVRQLVTFIRAWEPNAPDRKATPKPGDLARGADIFASVCAACHGDGGKGTDRAPALNDPVKLQQFDDSWYRDTIMKGRPAQGMPTWGTVLSPEQITDLLALVDSWRQATPAPPTPTLAATTGTGEEIARPSKAGGPGPALALTGDPTAGAQVFVQNCQKCHGAAGVGGVDNPGSTDGTVPPLKPIDSTLVDKDLKVFAFNVDLFIEHGSTPEGPSPKLTMPAWGDEKTLTPQQIADVIAYLIGLNP